MERAMSIEDKIKRAEEIYARRNGGRTERIRDVDNRKKESKGFKKLIIYAIICLFVYGVFYIVNNRSYIFSEEFINKVNDVFTNEINLGDFFNKAKNAIIGFFNNDEQAANAQENEQNQGNNDEQKDSNQDGNTVENNAENTEQNGIGGAVETQEPAPTLSEEEQRVQTILNTTSFIKPVEGKISSKYGVREPTTLTVPKNHTGTDIAANTGTKIKSATDGEVVLASSEGDYGNHLKIQIGEVSVIYAHCNKLYVKQGDIVKQGQEIAEVGSTGNSTGPHLHFEIRLNETTIDPEKILEL